MRFFIRLVCQKLGGHVLPTHCFLEKDLLLCKNKLSHDVVIFINCCRGVKSRYADVKQMFKGHFRR